MPLLKKQILPGANLVEGCEETFGQFLVLNLVMKGPLTICSELHPPVFQSDKEHRYHLILAPRISRVNGTSLTVNRGSVQAFY